METKDRKKLIISLIADDLVHTKLTDGLAALGLNPENYLLNLGDIIIQLMGFEGAENERVYAYYHQQLKRARLADNSEHATAFKKLANDIYHNLQLQRSLPKGSGRRKIS